jgi:hypothetical protein
VRWFPKPRSRRRLLSQFGLIRRNGAPAGKDSRQSHQLAIALPRLRLSLNSRGRLPRCHGITAAGLWPSALKRPASRQSRGRRRSARLFAEPWTVRPRGRRCSGHRFVPAHNPRPSRRSRGPSPLCRSRGRPPRCLLSPAPRRKQTCRITTGPAANQPSRPQRRRPLPSRDCASERHDPIEIKAQAGGPGRHARGAFRADAERRARIWAKAIAPSRRPQNSTGRSHRRRCGRPRRGGETRKAIVPHGLAPSSGGERARRTGRPLGISRRRWLAGWPAPS